jgi:putative transposase
MDRDWDKLKRWIIRRKLEEQPVTVICAHAQISRTMFYRWWGRYEAEGWEGLEERPRGRPKDSGPDRVVTEKVIRLRRRYEWGPNKIAGHLRHKGISIDHHNVYRVICEAGLNHPVSEPRKTWGKRRFVRAHSNSLWQADFKLCSDDYGMISFQDDHSRFVTGSDKVWNPTGENAVQLLEKSVKRFGTPEQVLTDQGTQFTPARGGISDFARSCASLGIEHIMASKRRPPTIGKIEAFHKAYENEAHLFAKHWSFIRYYNYTRPHQELNYLTPATIYFKDREV